MNEIKVNVKAKEKGVAGYTFKLNEQKPKEVIPELVYLNENKFKRVIERLQDPEAQATLIGLAALPFIPPVMKMYEPSLVGFFSPLAGAIKGSLIGFVGELGDTPKAIVVNGSITAAQKINEMDLYKKLEPIIDILQEIALPIGIIVSLWGCIEWIIGTPSWKNKIKTPIIGYAAIFGIPFIFKMIHDVLGTIA